MKRILAAVVTCLLLIASPAQADWKDTTKRWGLRAVGVVASFAVHEACHLAMGAALGARISTQNDPNGLMPVLIFKGLNKRGNRAVAMSGMACTMGVSELFIRKRWHTKDVGWGFVAGHAVNSAGYAFSNDGDALYFRESGGNTNLWKSALSLHAVRSGVALAIEEPWLGAR